MPTRNELIELIVNTMETVWSVRSKRPDIENWLKQFNGSLLKDIDIEQRIALLLLCNFVYYNMDEVRYLCRKIFKAYIHYVLENDIEYSLSDLNDSSIDIINNTIFIPVGNPSESGSNLLYYYRQENMLPKNRFYFDGDIEIMKAKNIVFIDDVSLTGTQVVKYLELNIKKYCDKNIFFTPLILTTDAKNYIEDELKEKFDCSLVLLPGLLLDEREKVFSDQSYIFYERNELMQVTKDFVEHYSKKFMIREPMGFENSQLALGFFYNIPNNTLPIFWANNEKYSGLFKRSPKVYGDSFKGVNYEQKHKYL